MQLPKWLHRGRRTPEAQPGETGLPEVVDDCSRVERAIDARRASSGNALHIGDGAAARRLLDGDARAVLPPASDLPEALGRADALARRGHGAGAASLLRPFAAGSARAALAYARAAVLAEPEQVLAIWLAAHERFSTPAIAAATAAALADHGRVDEAFGMLDAAIAQDARASLRLARIRLLERVGSLSAAAEAAQVLAAEYPSPAHDREASRLADDAGRPLATKRPEALQDGGEDAPAARRRANRLIAAGQLAEAVALLEDVVASRGEANDAIALVAAVLLAAEPIRGAALAAEFAGRWPGDARFPLKVAQVAERAGDIARARDEFLRAAAIESTNIWALTGVARMLIEEGAFGAARGWLDACARADASAPWPHAIRALAEVRDGQVDAARDALARAYERGRASIGGGVQAPDGAAGTRFSLSVTLFGRFLAELAASRSTMLVGNSPALLQQSLGADIDAADCVIRLNDFRIAGFEAHVGHRTDWWFSSANRQAEPDAGSIGVARSILTQPVPQHVPELPAFALGRLGLDLGPDRACFMPPAVHVMSDRALYPGRTTGLRMILILEFLVQAPFRAVGFDFFASSSLHYFENGADRLTVGESHAVAFERAFVNEVLRPLARFGRYD